MPYKRVGRCVFRKDTGKKVGCSNSIEKTKKYLTTLRIKAAEEDEESFVKLYEQLIQQYGN